MNVPGGLSFLKMNGLGNEIAIIDLRGTGTVLSAAEARAIAADPRSRFDQLMTMHDPKTPGTEAFIRIYNSDGSETSACGNGTRCIGWVESQRTGRTSLKFETGAGILGVAVETMHCITVDMGEPRFKWSEIPLAEPFHDTRAIELQIGPIEAPVLHSPSAVNVGNPHAVFWVDDVEAYDLGRLGPLLENHPMFPERANISLAHVASGTELRVRTWERGAGLTRACGTAACAAAVAAMRKGLAERKVKVALPGGELVVEWTPGNRILMSGPVEMEYEGRLEPAGMAPACA